MDFETIAERLGIPVALLVFIGLGVWRIGLWARAWVDKFLDRGLVHLDVTDAVLRDSAKAQVQTSDAIIQISATQKQMADTGTKTAENVRLAAEAAKAVAERQEAVLTMADAFVCKYKGPAAS